MVPVCLNKTLMDFVRALSLRTSSVSKSSSRISRVSDRSFLSCAESMDLANFRLPTVPLSIDYLGRRESLG